jgi:TetR/AcrR family transcriptional repressor of nem operon
MPRNIATNSSGATPSHILDVAERLAQTRGFNGFSYAHIAAEIGITTASLHYHFPTKADLGRALVARYTENFQTAIARIAASSESAPERLRRYVEVFQQVLGADRMCLCGMFAAEFATLPTIVQQELRNFFDQNERWLVRLLEDGLASGALRFDGDARSLAGLITGALEGTMLLARSYGDGARFRVPVDQLISSIVVDTSGRPTLVAQAPAVAPADAAR